MICYFEYGTGTAQVHLDLTNTEISLEEINPGAFATPSQELTQTAIRVTVSGKPNIYDTTQTIGDIINQCQVVNGRQISYRVYLYYQPAGQDTVYRARCRAIGFIPDPASGQYWKIQRFVKGEFQVIHEIWEGALTQIPLTNPYATNDTTGLRVDNTTDATPRYNYVAIDSLDVDGDAPAPVKIELTNSYNDANNVDRIFIGLNVWSTPGSFVQVLEAEDATGTGGDVVNAGYSNGKYTRITPPGGAIAATVFWNLSADDIKYMGGNQFHILMRLGPTLGADAYDCYYYLYLANDGRLEPVWLSDPLYLPASASYAMEDLGVIRMPPWRVDEAGLTQPMDFYMLAYSKDATAQNVDFDALHLYPVDGYRDIRPFAALYIGFTERLVDDMIEDELYQDTGAGTGRCNTIAALGNKIMLQPGKDQRLYFVALDDGALPGDVNRTWTVKAYYRPRRLAL